MLSPNVLSNGVSFRSIGTARLPQSVGIVDASYFREMTSHVIATYRADHLMQVASIDQRLDPIRPCAPVKVSSASIKTLYGNL